MEIQIIGLQNTLTFQKEAFVARCLRHNCGRARKAFIFRDEAHAAFVAGCACYSLAMLNQTGMRVSHFMRVAAIRPIPAKIAVRS